MADQPKSAVRDKTLRLTLSGHERQFIAEGQARALRSILILSVLLLLSAVSILLANTLYEPRDYAANPVRAEEKMVDGRLTYVVKQDSQMTQYYLFMGVVVISAVVGFVAALRLVFALVDLVRFRLYRNDHDKLLKRYRRRA